MKTECAAKCVHVFKNRWVDWFEACRTETIFVWEVPEFCLGRIHKTFIGRGNKLREFLSGWEGTPLSSEDVREMWLEDYAGRTCTLNIDHAEDWVHATVTGAAPRDEKLPMPERSVRMPESFLLHILSFMVERVGKREENSTSGLELRNSLVLALGSFLTNIR